MKCTCNAEREPDGGPVPQTSSEGASYVFMPPNTMQQLAANDGRARGLS